MEETQQVLDTLAKHEAASAERAECIKAHIDKQLDALIEQEKAMSVEDKINIHTGSDAATLAPLLAMLGNQGGGSMAALAPLLASGGGAGLGGNGIVTGLILGALLGRGGLGGLFGGADGAGAGVAGINNLAQNMDTNTILQTLGDIKASVPLAESQVQLALAGAQSDITQQTQAQTQAITQQLFAGQLANLQGFSTTKDAVDSLSTQTAVGIGNIISNNDKNAWAVSQAVVNDGDKTRALLVAQNEANLNRQLAVAEAALAEQRSVNRSREIEVNVTQQVSQQQAQAQQQQQLVGLTSLVSQLANQINRSQQDIINLGTMVGNTQSSANTNIR